MAKEKITTISDYIAAQPEAARPRLEKVRSTIRKAVPGAEEVISYGMPAFKLSGYILIYFAGWKQHYALYPATGLSGALAEDLAPYLESKATLRFPLSEPVPVRLITRFAKFRAAEALARAATRAAKKKKR